MSSNEHKIFDLLSQVIHGFVNFIDEGKSHRKANSGPQ